LGYNLTFLFLCIESALRISFAEKNTFQKKKLHYCWLLLMNFIDTELVLFHVSFILHAKKTGFVVEHDFIMATYLADRVVVFEGEPSVKTLANS